MNQCSSIGLAIPAKPTIGLLQIFPGGRPREIVDAFRRGLAEVGFSEGRDVTVEVHTADGHLAWREFTERLPVLAADLVRRKPAVIVADTAISALAAKAATRDIPIIFVVGNDPVELGLVASLNRHGGNLTGLANHDAEIAEKRLDLLHQAVPAAETIGLLVGRADIPYNQAETRQLAAASRYGRAWHRCWRQAENMFGSRVVRNTIDHTQHRVQKIAVPENLATKRTAFMVLPIRV